MGKELEISVSQKPCEEFSWNGAIKNNRSTKRKFAAYIRKDQIDWLKSKGGSQFLGSVLDLWMNFSRLQEDKKEI